MDEPVDSPARPLHVPRAASAPGNCIGDFRLVRLLGRGGMGEVWEAEQISLGRRVALKFVRPDRLDERMLSRFAREARAGARLHHEGVAAIHGFGRHEDVAWIAQELIPGGVSLREFLADIRTFKELPADYPKRTAAFVAQLADALEAAHRAGVIHRDVKPQNILITPADEPKLIDFGLARVLDETALSQTGEFAGTYLYMSPEQVAAGRMGIDHRTDVFSLGVVLYELLALVRPFEGDTTHQIAAKILTFHPPDVRTLRSQTPEALAIIVEKSLQKRPEDRYASMADLAADLRRFLSGEPIHARRPGPWRRARFWVRKHPTASAAAALLVLGFVATSAMAFRSSVQAERAIRERAAVMQLSAARELHDLEVEARELWPAHPHRVADYEDWMRRAGALVEKLSRENEDGGPGLRERLTTLRSKTLPWIAADRQRDRASHPQAPELERARQELAVLHAAEAVRSGVALAPEAEVDPESLPSTVRAQTERALALGGPDREEFGREAEAVQIAHAALVQAEDTELAGPMEALAWSLFALGEDEQALEIAAEMLEVAPSHRLEELRASAERLNAEVDGAQERLGALERHIAELDARLDENRRYRYADPDEEWWDRQLEDLIRGIETLADPTRGVWHADSRATGWSIDRRLEHARWLAERWSDDPVVQATWEDAIEAISDPQRSPLYGGLRIEPVVGLVPLGEDPDSRLWQFGELTCGELAACDADGRVRMNRESGLVFVLLPGGEVWTGSQSDDPGAPRFDPLHEVDEALHAILLQPFYVSKYEMTSDQWERFATYNPSGLTSTPAQRAEFQLHGVHPIDTVSWLEAVEFLRRLGCGLPSEAQWEYAARGGTDTPWFCGAEKECLARCANICERSGFGDELFLGEDWDDRCVLHAEVGSFAPNPFGLFDVLGNVSEWCLDERVLSPTGASAEKAAERAVRGGSYGTLASAARCATRGGMNALATTELTGLRPVMPAALDLR